MRLITRDKDEFRYIFDELKDFETTEYSVSCLAKSIMEEFDEKLHDKEFNKDEKDRNWDWKNEKYEISPHRYNISPGYFGSYCMDAMALSLHYAYHSKNATKAILKAVNCGGDSDSVAAITGQIVGAIYGLETEILDLYKEMNKWDSFSIATAAYKLMNFKNQKKETLEKEENEKFQE